MLFMAKPINYKKKHNKIKALKNLNIRAQKIKTKNF